MDNFDSTTKKCPGRNRESHIEPISAFSKDKGRYDGLTIYCRECNQGVAAGFKGRLRLQALDILGLSCVRCGYADDIRALSLDHIDGNGSERRKAGENSAQIYRAIIAGSKDFQVLCCNCNRIKQFEMNEWRRKTSYVRASLPEMRKEPKPNNSETMEQKRTQLVVDEMGPTHQSWLVLGLNGCQDCGSRIKPRHYENICVRCYKRYHEKLRRYKTQKLLPQEATVKDILQLPNKSLK